MDDTTIDQLLTELDEVDPADAPEVADRLAVELEAELDDLDGEEPAAPPS